MLFQGNVFWIILMQEDSMPMAVSGRATEDRGEFQGASSPERFSIIWWIILQQTKAFSQQCDDVMITWGDHKINTEENLAYSKRPLCRENSKRPRKAMGTVSRCLITGQSLRLFLLCFSVCTHWNIAVFLEEAWWEDLEYIQLCYLAVTSILLLLGWC